MEQRELEPGNKVRLNEKARDIFVGKTMIIEEPKGFGAVGYIEHPDGKIYYRAGWDEMDVLEKE